MARTDPTGSEGFEALFELHARTIYNSCFRRTGDWAQAEGLTSVVFLEAWRRRGQVDLVDEPALPWLYGVATNVVRNARRSLRRHRAAMERMPAVQPTPDFAQEAAERLDDERRMREVLDAVRELPRHDQEVLALCAWEGLSYEDAARALEVPVGTVRSRLSRARARLTALEGAAA